MIEPPKPSSRSCVAHAALATPPPISRTSTSAMRRSVRSAAVGRELLGDRLLEARVEDQEDRVADLDERVGLGHEALAAPQDGDDQAALRQVDLLDRLAGRGRAGGHLDLDDLELLGREVE